MNAHDLIFPDKGLAGKILLPIEGKYVRGIEGVNLTEKYSDVIDASIVLLPEIENSIYFVTTRSYIVNTSGVNYLTLICKTINDIDIVVHQDVKVDGNNNITYLKGKLPDFYMKSLLVEVTSTEPQFAFVNTLGYQLLLGDL